MAINMLLFMPSAADLKFLHRCRNLVQELQIEKRYWNHKVASAPFASKVRADDCCDVSRTSVAGTRALAAGSGLIPVARSEANRLSLDHPYRKFSQIRPE
jgi:hypothetical protein